MGLFDEAALVFATVVVALTVVAEIKDITMCTLAIRHAGEKLSPGWRFILMFLGGIRRWLFLPTLVSAVPILVLYKGGDALSICFNTVAILFLCEIDNIMLEHGLGEEARNRVVECGRVDLSAGEAKFLVRTKTVHVCLITVFVPAAVRSQSAMVVLLLPPLGFWLGGVAEEVGARHGVCEIYKGVGIVTGKCLLGLGGFATLAMACFYSV